MVKKDHPQRLSGSRPLKKLLTLITEFILTAKTRADGNVSRAAELMGVDQAISTAACAPWILNPGVTP